MIVVDNNSNDDSEEAVRTNFPNVTLIQTGANTGYAAGNNIAFSQAKGNLLLTLNPDTEMYSGTLDIAIQELQSRPECGALSVKFRGPEGEIQSSVRGFPTLKNLFGEITGIAKRKPGTGWASYSLPDFDYEKSQYAPQPMGTFLLFKREALQNIGSALKPFDEQFPIFFNEVDLLKRLDDEGVKCWYCAETEVFHHHGSSTKQVRASMIWESHKSLVRYLKKHLRGAARIFLPLAALASYFGAFVRAKGYHAGFRTEHHNLQLEHD